MVERVKIWSMISIVFVRNSHLEKDVKVSFHHVKFPTGNLVESSSIHLKEMIRDFVFSDWLWGGSGGKTGVTDACSILGSSSVWIA